MCGSLLLVFGRMIFTNSACARWRAIWRDSDRASLGATRRRFRRALYQAAIAAGGGGGSGGLNTMSLVILSTAASAVS